MLSIVMPAYNEEEIIETTVREWHEEVIAKIHDAELIVVNDCSEDRTGLVLERLARELPALRALTPARNGGHGKALRYGFDHATRPWVFQTDSDRQHVPSDFWKLWDPRDASDFVMGVRSTRADGSLRIVITNAMRLANLAAWGTWIRDANCPFKLMRREAMERVLSSVPRDSFIPMVMLSILSRKMGYRITEVLVNHLPRRGGEQSLRGLWKWLKVGSICLCQLVAWRLSLIWKAHDAARIPEIHQKPAR
jgi:glycosyltransferase involved in cell wall biosynthesis